jgi:DNA-binding NtrC family response regulator
MKPRPRRVLIIEDVPEMLELLRQLVAGLEGFQESGAADCSEARVELTRRRPDVVLLDEILPGESSLDLLQEFQSEGIPVILMTGMENPAHPLPPGVKVRLIKPDWRTLEKDKSRFATAIRDALT